MGRRQEGYAQAGEGRTMGKWEGEEGFELAVVPDPILASQAAGNSLWLLLSTKTYTKNIYIL